MTDDRTDYWIRLAMLILIGLVSFALFESLTSAIMMQLAASVMLTAIQFK